MDDEPSIQDITKISLELHQYQTLIAGDGIEAIAIYAKNMDKISAVVMNIMLPSLDGLTAIRTLRKINPQVKIIATSGLISQNRSEEVVESGADTFLPKPYTINELLLALHEVITSCPKNHLQHK